MFGCWITREFLPETAFSRCKNTKTIFEMKFAFMCLHLFPWESKQSRRVIGKVCPQHTPKLKYLLAFDTLYSHSPGQRVPVPHTCLASLILVSYHTVQLQLLLRDRNDWDIKRHLLQYPLVLTSGFFPEWGTISRTAMSVFGVVFQCANVSFSCSAAFL